VSGSALIGATGFVGGVLRGAQPFDGQFHSRNIAQLPMRDWDEIVCAGMPAEKWRANKYPEADAAALEWLWSPLQRVTARRVVLISTVDVYDEPWNKNEEDRPDATHAYGRNRAELERRVLQAFDDAAVVRLSALYGPGLKKNALYDLLCGRPCPTSREALFQWYDIERLPRDLATVQAGGLQLAQIVSGPVSMGEVVDRCFPSAETAESGAGAPRYDLRTKHADLFGGREGYVEDTASSLAGVERFVARIRSGEVACASPSA